MIIGGNIEAHRVAPKLYVGSVPPQSLTGHGFDVVVLCALEDQIPRDILTVHVPLVDIDSPMSRDDIFAAVGVAQLIHGFRQDQQRVLVTCAAGVNRSAFVAALALVRGGWTPSGAIERIRERRVPPVGLRPLSNKQFVRIIHGVAGKTPPRQRGRA